MMKLYFLTLCLFSSVAFSQDMTVGNRGTQTLNPDISVILDGVGGYWARKPLTLAGDDPDLQGTYSGSGGGFTIQEAEVAFQSIIDPYLRGDVFLTIPNQGKLEIEEAFLTTTSLPFDLQIKAGIFRAAMGRQNSQHLHIQDFTRRPLVNQNFLGVDGLDAPGVEVNWLAPLPFYSLLIAEAFSVDRPDDFGGTTLQSFGGGGKQDLTDVLAWKNFFPIGDEYSVYLGLDYAQGRAATPTDSLGGFYTAGNNLRSRVYGADLYVKYKPANVSHGFNSWAWQTEFFQRQLIGDNTLGTQSDGGFYTQFVYQLSQRWFLGGRYDALGLPTSQFIKSVNRFSASLTFAMTEFSRVRLYGEQEIVSNSDFGNQLNPVNNYAAMVQVEVAMGAHGAHPF